MALLPIHKLEFVQLTYHCIFIVIKYTCLEPTTMRAKPVSKKLDSHGRAKGIGLFQTWKTISYFKMD